MSCFRFANVMNNTAIMNSFNSDNSNIACAKTQHGQVMITFTNRTLKFKPVFKKPIAADNTFFTVITFNSINSFT